MGSSFNATALKNLDSNLLTPTEALALLIINVPLIIFHVPICVATYRASRKINTFILFFSETLTDALALSCSVTSSAILVLAMGTEAGNAFQSSLLCTMTSGLVAHLSLMHSLLIAVNRTFAVLFPLQYNKWWTRRVVLYSTLSVWLVGMGVLKVGEAVASVLMASPDQGVLDISGIVAFIAIYSTLQPPITYGSLALYSLSLVWVLVRRLVGSGGSTIQIGTPFWDFKFRQANVPVYKNPSLRLLPALLPPQLLLHRADPVSRP
jgi:Serpentine type 7TM GPCR chemoreceptor Srx